MILDSSALVAAILGEPSAVQIRDALHQATSLGVGAPTLVESGIVLAARIGGAGPPALTRFATELRLVAIPFGDDHVRVALDAWRRFGKGRHPAALNLGDCLSYATARIAGRPLVCVGADFARTDIEVVALGAS